MPCVSTLVPNCRCISAQLNVEVYRLLLVCDNCDVALRHTYFCDEHKHLDPKDVHKNLVTLQTYAADLVNKINSLHLLGRRNKAKRQTLNRQLSEIRSLLAAATDQSQP